MPRYPAGIAQAVSDPEVIDELDRVLCEQARRYLSAQPWARLGSNAVYVMLKVGSWYQACVQAFVTESNNVLFLFPGWRNFRDLQKAGFDKPPPGTVFAELRNPDPAFHVIESDGQLPLDLFSGRMLALALAAMVDLGDADQSPEAEIRGKLQLPGGGLGRYRAVRAPADPGAEHIIPMMGVLRHDLYADGDATVSFMRSPWSEFGVLAERAQLHVPSAEPFVERGESIPVVVVSAPIKVAWSIADKLHAAKPLGMTFGKTEEGIVFIAGGRHEWYALMTTEDAGGAIDFLHEGIDSSGGVSALIVVDTTPDPDRYEEWRPTNVLAVFEFGANNPFPSARESLRS